MRPGSPPPESSVVLTLARVLHRVAVLAYPPAFRRDFGPELQAIFEQRQASAAPGFPAAGLAFFQVVDAVATGIAERLRSAATRWAWPGRATPSTYLRSRSMSFESLLADLRLAVRQCRRTPLFALVTAATLALGIGANSAIFGVVYSVLWRPLPYNDPNALVMVWSNNTKQGEPRNPVSPANYDAFRSAPSLARVEGMYSFVIPVAMRLGAEPEVVQGSAVTPGMLDLLGRPPLLGRTFQAGDTTPAVVLGYDLWQRRFGADRAIVGRTIAIDGLPQKAMILGVMPEDFVFPYRSMLGPTGFSRPQRAEIYLPLTTTFDPRLVDASGQPNRTLHYLGVIARLKPGLTVERASADLTAIARERAGRFPDTNAGWDVTVRALHEQTVGELRPALLTLLGGVAVVLMITCLNVANVLLARATGRRRDLAVRTALGASRARLIQQTLVESLLLSRRRRRPRDRVDGRRDTGDHRARPGEPAEAGGSVAECAGGPLRAGCSRWPPASSSDSLPALSAARSDAQESLRDVHRTTASRARQRVRSAFVVAEVALAMTLTIGAGLLLRSFVSVLGVDAGFASGRLLTLQMGVPPRLTDGPSRLAFYDDLEARLRAVPGVVKVGGTTRLPLGSTSVTSFIEVEGRNTPPADRPEVEFRRAVFDYFGAMEIPLLGGRLFAPEDAIGTPSVAVVNTMFVAKVFPGEEAIGKKIRLGGSTGPWTTIVGIVGSIRHRSLEEAPKPELYVTYRQNPPVSPFVAIKTAADPTLVVSGVRQAIRDAGADPPNDVRTMDQIRSSSVGERRFVLLLVALFGGVTLVLAGLGVYGVITLVAAERTAEVGIRLALGAAPVQVMSLVIGQAVRLAVIGIAIGGAVALALTPFLAWQLFGIGPADPLTYLTVGLTLAITAMVAALVPARRAMKIDPATTLKA